MPMARGAGGKSGRLRLIRHPFWLFSLRLWSFSRHGDSGTQEDGRFSPPFRDLLADEEDEDEMTVAGVLLVIEHAPRVIGNAAFEGFTEYRLMEARRCR
jgi:hypothetical protein